MVLVCINICLMINNVVLNSIGLLAICVLFCEVSVGCMRQVLGTGALGRPRGIGWRGSWEGGPGWGIHVSPWLIHFNV